MMTADVNRLGEYVRGADSAPDIFLDAKDLRFDVFRSRGHGGQCVNTTDSAVRVVHVPTGFSAVSRRERSQLKNRELAVADLKEKMFRSYTEAERQRAAEARRERVAAESPHHATSKGSAGKFPARNREMDEALLLAGLINSGEADLSEILEAEGL